jgi:predicted Holliday junction resolvase-like endonuclease
MTIARYKLATVILGIISIVVIVMTIFLFVDYSSLTLRLMMASEQVRIFEEMRVRAVQTDPSEAARCLDYVKHYYPSGTKQVVGSRLDRLVEQARSSAVREIVASIRNKTGEDLGKTVEP